MFEQKTSLTKLILIVSSNLIPKGEIESLRENLDAVRRLAKLLLVRPESSAAVELGTRGGNKTAERGPEYFRETVAKRKTRAGGRPKKYQEVLITGESPSNVRSRAAFIIAQRAKELAWIWAVAKAIHCTEPISQGSVARLQDPFR